MVDIPVVHRPAFFDGQRLFAGDLADAQAYHRELRWLHNRSLHNWGIAFGMAVAGKRKGRTVHVEPGYAIDCQGRELILYAPEEIAIPPVAGIDGEAATYFLTASYAEDAEITPETRAGICGTSGAVRRPEEALIRWQEPSDGYRFGLDIVLASISVLNCQLAADVSTAERRDAIPEQQPYIGTGQTAPGETKWRLWPNDDQPLGVATTVNTTSAGFRTGPRYQAHVIGDRVMPDSEIVIDGYAQVTQHGPFGFDLVVLLPQGSLLGGVLNPPFVIDEDLPAKLESDDPDKSGMGWYVVWVGVEGE